MDWDFRGRTRFGCLSEKRFCVSSFLKGSFGEQEVRTITADRNHWMWVGTNNGIYVFHPDSLLNDSRQYYVYNLDNGKIRSNEIRNIFCDSKGRMWIGTTGKGFSVCQSRQTYDQLEFRHYDEDDGLVNNVVQSIVEDRDGKSGWVPNMECPGLIRIRRFLIVSFFQR